MKGESERGRKREDRAEIHGPPGYKNHQVRRPTRLQKPPGCINFWSFLYNDLFAKIKEHLVLKNIFAAKLSKARLL